MLRRRRLLEIHEQSRCPAGVRDGATDCLQVVADWGRQYSRVTPKLNQALRATGVDAIVDLCSGGGGPWHTLRRHIRPADGRPVTVHLTDRFPSANAAQRRRRDPHIRYVPEPVDAMAVPPELSGLRTLFTAFHHFTPADAMLILHDAVARRQGIAVFEQTQRSWGGIALMLVLAPIVMLAAPFMRPFRWSRLFWTYVLPVLPLVLCVDGIVSCLRTYTVDELRAMARAVDPADAYVWEAGRLPSPLSPLGVTYLMGYPRPEPRPESGAPPA